MATRTESIPRPGDRFRVGNWIVEPSLNRITRLGVAVEIERKAMEVLVVLAERAGDVVDRKQLLDAIWQTEFVSDNTVAARIYELREAFEDDARNPRYIDTIPKRGYRLIADVRFATRAEHGAGAPVEATLDPRNERRPYPGLAPFIEADAADFFGRGVEVATLWRKIASRRLLAVVGPSGAGKSSLVRAGVAATAPPGWRVVVCQPGSEPFLAVARAMAPDLAGDAEEMRRLLAFHDPDMALAVAARWRGRWDEALLVVDQFEELFTLNQDPARERVAGLLRRLVDAAGIHVVLVLRDDSLIHCHRHRDLDPIFRDLTPVAPPAGRELRRALCEAAARRLFDFESELLVEELVGKVEAERGALSLLALTVSRLWELRDRDRRLLTREAYQQIGGVGGALAEHAEATLEAVGAVRLQIVRELFRNLVTAQGTRAVREWNELLSVFSDAHRETAEELVRELIDARLLTSFELREGDGEPTRIVEIVHESLLTSWPRLVRWQAQEADAAPHRDHLRQAARTWEERGRSDDLLWSGSAFREYALWRERYPGGLSELEEVFAAAMTALATRRRRRRRVAVVAAIVLAAAAAIIVGAL
jgi:DNA-binding winged helix-turn-helix (wHTH) protein